MLSRLQPGQTHRREGNKHSMFSPLGSQLDSLRDEGSLDSEAWQLCHNNQFSMFKLPSVLNSPPNNASMRRSIYSPTYLKQAKVNKAKMNMLSTRQVSPAEERVENPVLRRELDALRLVGNNCNEVVKVMLKKPHYQKLAKI